MKKKSISQTSINDLDECPEWTQADIDRSVMRINLKPVERKQRISIMLDSKIVSHFKAQAGARGYQTMINEVLRKSIEYGDLEGLIRKAIREELKQKTA